MKNHDTNKKIQLNKCWWCGETASSAEHKYKKSDLVSSYGKGPYKNNAGLIWVSPEGKERMIRGPKSKMVKFTPNLCEKCNNSRSQPFDLAYDEFSNYIRTNKQVVYSSREINFDNIFGDNWKSNALNLYRYLTKHAMCRISNSLPIATDVIDFLNGHSTLYSLSFKFSVPFDVAEIIHFDFSDLALAMGKVIIYSDQTTGLHTRCTSSYDLGWFRFNWQYQLFRPAYEFEFEKHVPVHIDNETPNALSVYKEKLITEKNAENKKS